MFVPNGKPGIVINGVQATPRSIIYSGLERVMYIPYPATIDGTLSWWPANTPYTWQLPAGLMMGQVTSTKKYTNALYGLTTAATSASSTGVTVSTATAAYLLSRGGASGTFLLIGPPTAGGSNATQTVTYSAINTTTGVITASAISAATVSGSLVQPMDGSQVIKTLIADTYGVKVVDAFNTTRVDNFDPRLLLGGGVVNQGYIIDYPSDATLKTFVKTALKNFCAGVAFLDDVTG